MEYLHTVQATFLSRPNRFIAEAMLEGQKVICHVKNTGRCRELLVPGATVVLSRQSSPSRATAFDLVAVYKGHRLINMDSQAPNKAAAAFLPTLFPGYAIRPEVKYGASRFDFMLDGPQPGYLEVKGVTLEENARKAIADGLDVAIVYPAEGTSVLPDGAAIVRGCAHEENARQFIDFLLSPDVQQLLGTELSRRSVRADTASDALPELTVLPYDLRRADERRQELFDAWQALCGEVEA